TALSTELRGPAAPYTMHRRRHPRLRRRRIWCSDGGLRGVPCPALTVIRPVSALLPQRVADRGSPRPPRCVVERAIDPDFFLRTHPARGYASHGFVLHNHAPIHSVQGTVASRHRRSGSLRVLVRTWRFNRPRALGGWVCSISWSRAFDASLPSSSA